MAVFRQSSPRWASLLGFSAVAAASVSGCNFLLDTDSLNAGPEPGVTGGAGGASGSAGSSGNAGEGGSAGQSGSAGAAGSAGSAGSAGMVGDCENSLSCQDADPCTKERCVYQGQDCDDSGVDCKSPEGTLLGVCQPSEPFVGTGLSLVNAESVVYGAKKLGKPTIAVSSAGFYIATHSQADNGTVDGVVITLQTGAGTSKTDSIRALLGGVAEIHSSPALLFDNSASKPRVVAAVVGKRQGDNRARILVQAFGQTLAPAGSPASFDISTDGSNYSGDAAVNVPALFTTGTSIGRDNYVVQWVSGGTLYHAGFQTTLTGVVDPNNGIKPTISWNAIGKVLDFAPIPGSGNTWGASVLVENSRMVVWSNTSSGLVQGLDSSPVITKTAGISNIPISPPTTYATVWGAGGVPEGGNTYMRGSGCTLGGNPSCTTNSVQGTADLVFPMVYPTGAVLRSPAAGNPAVLALGGVQAAKANESSGFGLVTLTPIVFSTMQGGNTSRTNPPAAIMGGSASAGSVLLPNAQLPKNTTIAAGPNGEIAVVWTQGNASGGEDLRLARYALTECK